MRQSVGRACHRWPLFEVALVGLIIGLSGCAGNSRPDSAPSVPGQVQVIDSQPMVEEAENDTVIKQTPTVAGGAAAESSGIETQFLQAASSAQAQQDWHEAIEQAERGLRVNRRQPELYLILAQSYWQLGKQSLASQFARQGLRYLERGSEVLQSNLEQMAYPNRSN